jgi:hypothetical protein
VVTKRSGQAQTALISRRPPTVERARGVTHPERISATTNPVRIGDPIKRTRIRKESESNLLAVADLQARSEGWGHCLPLGCQQQSLGKSMICQITDLAGQQCFTFIQRQAWLPNRCRVRCTLRRSGTRSKEAGTKGAGISDTARRAIRQTSGNPNSPSWSAIVTPWSPKRSLFRSLADPIWDAAKGTGTKGAGISDAARRAIRHAEGNPNSRNWSGAVRDGRQSLPPLQRAFPDPGH